MGSPSKFYTKLHYFVDDTSTLDINDLTPEYFGIKYYTFNDDGTMDIHQNDTQLDLKNFTHFPYRFGKIKGNFDCSHNKLESLDGAPSKVGGKFYCHNNRLTDLAGGPSEVGSDYDCSHNELTSLSGAPTIIKRSFLCHSNNLPSFDYCPKRVGKMFFCDDNNISSVTEYPMCIIGERIGTDHEYQKIFDAICETIKENTQYFGAVIHNRERFLDLITRLCPELSHHFK